MAKKKKGSRKGSAKGSVSKKPSKKKRGGRKADPKKAAERKRAVAMRIALHEAATKLADFHGGHLPVRSGCGRPRLKKEK